MSKHTPGPWLTEPSVRGFEVTANDVRIGEARDEANARLMAAAPELLAVLRAARDSISDSLVCYWLPGYDFHDSLSDALDAIDATIEDATKEEA